MTEPCPWAAMVPTREPVQFHPGALPSLTDHSGACSPPEKPSSDSPLSCLSSPTVSWCPVLLRGGGSKPG